ATRNPRRVRILLSPAKAVLPVGTRLVGLPRPRLVLPGRPARRDVRLRAGRARRPADHRRVVLLVDALPVVLPLLRRRRGDLRRLLALLLAPSLGALVDPGLRADPVRDLLPGP